MTADPVPNPRPRCPVCKSPHKVQIHALRATKMDYQTIHDEMVKMGVHIKRVTLGRHFRICLNGITPELLAQEVADASAAAKTVAEMDFATLVQKRATELLAKGELRVTAQHGLTAQALLDRRAEKAADRDLTINIARLLSGAMIMPPVTVIEGRVVEPLALDDGLAPDGVFEAVR